MSNVDVCKWQGLTSRWINCCSSHRSISFRESVLPPNDSAIHQPIARQSTLIPSSFLELFFSSPFGYQPTTWEHLAHTHDRPLSPPQKNTRQLASHSEEPALQSVTRATCYSETHIVREHLARSQDRQTFLAFTEEHAATSFTHGRTSLAVSHTSNSLQWHTHLHTYYKLKDQTY